jgi:hypothetical protein
MMRYLLACGSLLALGSFAFGQSLGEVAERTKQERKEQSPAKRYTEKDLDRVYAERAARGELESSDAAESEPPPVARPSAPRASAPPRSGAGGGGAGAELAALDAKISRWRTRYRAVQARVDSLEKQVAALEEEKSRTLVDARHVYDPTRPRRRENVPQPESVGLRLMQAQRQLDQARKELEDVIEQARVDGVSSGQLY